MTLKPGGKRSVASQTCGSGVRVEAALSPRHRFLRLVTILAALIGGTALADQVEAPYPLQLWRDPQFKKQFLREYGANPGIEPKVSDVERQQMEKLAAFMDKKPLDCLAALGDVATPQSTAEFDFVLGQLSQQTNQPIAKTIGHYQAAIRKFENFRRAHNALGRLLAQDGKYDAALKYLARAMELGQADPVLFGLLGFCHLALDHAGSAESAYRTALVMQPDSLDWKMGLIRALLKQSKADEVIAFCDEMIAADPANAELWMLQSSAFLSKKDYLHAATSLEMFVRQGGGSSEDLLRLGDIYLNEQLPAPALFAYGRALNHSSPPKVTDAIRVVEATAARGALPQARELLLTVRTAYSQGLADADKRRLMKTEARIAVAEGKGGFK